MNQEKTIQSIKAWTPRQPVKELMDLLADLDRGFQKDKLIEDLPLSEKYKNELAGLSHYPIWACDNDGNCLVGDSADAIEPAAAIIEYYKLHGGAREVEAGPEEYHIRKLAAALENVARGHEQSALDRNQITFGFSSGAEELLDMSSRITQSLVELGACHQYTNKSWSLRFDSSDAGDGTDDVDQSSLWLVGEFLVAPPKSIFWPKSASPETATSTASLSFSEKTMWLNVTSHFRFKNTSSRTCAGGKALRTSARLIWRRWAAR